MLLPRGLSSSIPVALATAPVAMTFGMLAAPVIGPVPAVLMSALVWAGGAQFAALGVLAAGGPLTVAGLAALATNGRYLPMGFALAPSTGGPLWKRFAAGAVLTDASFVIARDPVHRRFDPAALFWAAPLQYASWVGGTAAGAFGAQLLGDPRALGLDTIFPIFFLGLLLPELRTPFVRRTRSGARGHTGHPARIRVVPALAAALAAIIVLATTAWLPPGLPLLAGALVALIGLWPGTARRS